MLISPSGKNLNIVISNKSSVTDEWMTFSSWYSFFKNAPDANVTFSCLRSSTQNMHQLFNWANRLNVKFTYYSNKSKQSQHLNRLLSLKTILKKNMSRTPLLCIEPDVLLTGDLDVDILNDYYDKNQCVKSENNKVWFITNEQFVLDSIDDYFLKNSEPNMDICTSLCKDAKSTANSLITYEKGCGRFVTAKWIDNKKGCPFGKASRFRTDSLTTNEKRMLDLWRKLVPLYKAIF